MSTPLLRVYMNVPGLEGRQSGESPLSEADADNLAIILAKADADPAFAALFEQVLAQKWPEIAAQMVADGKLAYIPSLEEADPEFELVMS